MKTTKIVIYILIAATLINAVRTHWRGPLSQVFPFCGGRRPIEYTLGGICMLVIFVWGLARLGRRQERQRWQEKLLASRNASRDSTSKTERRSLFQRFRWGIIGALGGMFLLAWFLHNIRPGLSWDDIMDKLKVHNVTQYSMLAILGIVLITILVVKRTNSDSK